MRKKSSFRVQWTVEETLQGTMWKTGGNIQKCSFKKERQRQRGEKRRGLIPLKLVVL